MELLPRFQFQLKYLSFAVSCIKNILMENQQILGNLKENIDLDFDFQNQKEIIEDPNKKIKILINLFDDESLIQQNQIKVHEKIIHKPLNLILYFFNLLWDEKSPNKTDYLSILNKVSSYQDKPINENQTNLFKLYLKY